MEWAGQGGSGPGIIFGSLGVTEENHGSQINLRGSGAAIWSQMFPIAGELVVITKLLQQTSV